MINCFYDCYNILNKVYGEKTFLKQAISETIIEEKNRPLTIKICYGVLDKDIELSYYIKSLTEKSPKAVIRIILKIAMYSIKYLQKKGYAVTQNTVELVKKLGKGGMSGFVNAFLRKFLSSSIELPQDLLENLSVKYSYPKFVIDKLFKVYNKERVEKILGAQNIKTTLAFYSEGAEEYLKRRQINYKKTPFENVFSTQNFVRDEMYDKGFYTYQALGSVAICDVVKPCDSLLDCCAAPGGKSIRLSYKCNKITSWDIHEHRVGLIKSYINRMNRNNICATVKDAKQFDENLTEKFDAVLCDAPCSGLGVVNDNPDIKLFREESQLLSILEEQKSILANVSKYVKVGGILYYSTCSILKCENSDIIKDFLQKNNNFVLEQIDSPLPHEKDNGIVFMPDISCGLGFFVSALKKIK